MFENAWKNTPIAVLGRTWSKTISKLASPFISNRTNVLGEAPIVRLKAVLKALSDS